MKGLLRRQLPEGVRELSPYSSWRRQRSESTNRLPACACLNDPSAHLWLDGDLPGRSSFLFCGGKGFDPLVLCKPSLPLSQPHTTFVISHNDRELNPIPRPRPAVIFEPRRLIDTIERKRTHPVNNKVASIVKEPANQMISRLNLGIRFSYPRAQLISRPLAGGSPAAPIDPREILRNAAKILPSQRTNISFLMITLKNAGALKSRIGIVER